MPNFKENFFSHYFFFLERQRHKGGSNLCVYLPVISYISSTSSQSVLFQSRAWPNLYPKTIWHLQVSIRNASFVLRLRFLFGVVAACLPRLNTEAFRTPALLRTMRASCHEIMVRASCSEPLGKQGLSADSSSLSGFALQNQWV
jgi:hypothetical protein